MTPQEAARRFGLLPKEIDRLTINAIRRAQNYWRKLTLEGVASKGVGAGIWGARSRTKKAKRLTSLRPIVKRERVVRAGDGFIGGLKLTGLAALQETGGQTKAHTIRAIRTPLLIFEGAKGWTRKLQVNHPGSRIPAAPSAAPAVPEVSRYLQNEVTQALVDATAKAGLLG